MNKSHVNLLDLPNELLFIILNKLDNIDVLYSLFSINNKRLDKCILLVTSYPNLTELKIFYCQRDNSLDYFTDESTLRHIFKQEIKKLYLINKDHERTVESLKVYIETVYEYILTYFEKLEYLNIIETSICAYPGLSIRYLSSNIFSSSILTYLSINVGTLTDCIYLLDGRLKQLNTFIIRIYQMDLDSSIVHNLISIFYLFSIILSE
ncbi:unnamed protein product [Rotaria sordida]|uniref:F-box domain-containing protein n=1 Tax=Rotaria sordida TaxID=392033 RepID=A0A814WKY7_9BILA|nr:unnamed protein product [Rotaria sordida]